MKIFLIGMPGAGKTTLGKQVADELGFQFIDLDAEIENREAMSVAEIFRQKGEDHFRIVESEVLGEWIASSHSVVVATGGGAPCFNKGIEKMNSSGITVFIDSGIGELARRTSRKPGRPLLDAASPEELVRKLEHLYKIRFPYYSQANITLRDPSAKEILKKIQLRK